MTRILICDDSHEDLDAVSKIVDNFYSETDSGNVTAAYSLSRFSNPKAALSYIKDGNAIDIAILDIMMPEMTGMELATGMRESGFGGYLIFLTSSNDFAAQSYSVKAFSYILKPADHKKVSELILSIEKARQASDRNGFSLTRKGGVRFVLYSEVMFVEVVDHQLYFHLIDGEVISIRATLGDYSDKLLSEHQMIKPQKSFIVNLDYVRTCENKALFMRDGTRISSPADFESVKEKWLERLFGQEEW